MSFIFPLETADQKAVVACGVIFSFLAVLSVILRVLARHRANRTLDWSDYFVIAACFFAVVYQGVSISSVLVGGVGFHVDEIKNRFGIESGEEMFLKHTIANQLLWAISLCLCRVSILVLSTKIFLVQSFIVTARITYVVVLGWGLTAILTAFLLCRPFAYNWDRSIEGGVCGDPTVSWAVTGVLNMISDIIILIMPMPYLLRLELAWEKRLQLMVIFGILVLPCIVSVARIAEMIMMDFNDITFSSPHTILLSSLEPCLSVMASCAMTMRPLFGGRYSPDGTAGFTGPPIAPLTKRNSNRRFQTLNENTSETRLRPEEVGYQASIAKSSEPFMGFGRLGELGLEMGAISIRQEWIVKEEPRPSSSGTGKDKSVR
ncbi:uncharacterized protein F4812DRAFT_461964 [Daldinia caldariorum]|uniref:uncharacterized protein n=1 Tax=Daldinia caldariorum TaxID=326644 RepID=UPI0020088F06|nr:uncharacterized protein F4812DRAFT_461964 [Daldinia caldariorum]KAI1465122.1 hypothetical protein F4812DRAFT_461964 [Daldinia caldariorum]